MGGQWMIGHGGLGRFPCPKTLEKTVKTETIFNFL